MKKEDESTEWVELENKENIPQGTVVKVNIPKEYYENRVGETIKIKVHAKDIKGAETIKEYEIKPVLDPINYIYYNRWSWINWRYYKL